MEHEKVERINELARLAKQRELTPEEQTERAALRKEYLDGFRENMRQVLEGIKLQRPDGTLEPLKQKQDKHEPLAPTDPSYHKKRQKSNTKFSRKPLSYLGFSVIIRPSQEERKTQRNNASPSRGECPPQAVMTRR